MAAFRASPEYQAGVAVADITPDNPIRLSGYGSRTKPSEGVRTRLHAKALAIARGKNERVVIVTTDLIGLPRSMTDVVAGAGAAALRAGAQRFGSIPRTRTRVRISGGICRCCFELNAADKTVVDAYAERLQGTLVKIVGQALDNLRPATIAVAHGEAHFGINRREATDNGIKIGVNPTGPKI